RVEELAAAAVERESVEGARDERPRRREEDGIVRGLLPDRERERGLDGQPGGEGRGRRPVGALEAEARVERDDESAGAAGREEGGRCRRRAGQRPIGLGWLDAGRRTGPVAACRSGPTGSARRRGVARIRDRPVV